MGGGVVEKNPFLHSVDGCEHSPAEQMHCGNDSSSPPSPTSLSLSLSPLCVSSPSPLPLSLSLSFSPFLSIPLSPSPPLSPSSLLSLPPPSLSPSQLSVPRSFRFGTRGQERAQLIVFTSGNDAGASALMEITALTAVRLRRLASRGRKREVNEPEAICVEGIGGRGGEEGWWRGGGGG